MISQEVWMNIKLLRHQGMSIRAIARTTGLSRQCVRRALKQTVPSTYKPRSTKPAKLDPFKDHLRSQLDLRPWISAAQLYRELIPKGFSGHYELVKSFCRSERQLLKARQNACVRFETAPGLEAQFDWKGPVTGLLAGDPPRKLYFFRLLLGYSRFRITRVVSHITLPAILADLSDVLTELGGVPQRIVFDNFKAAVITPRPNLRLHPFFADFCSHFGFEPAPAFPYSPQRKGKTERSFRDLESSDLLHQTCSDMTALQLQLTLDDKRHASTIHSSTGERPADRLDRERPFLRPLPDVAFDPRLPQTRKVLSDCTISFEGAYYSVPWKLVGKRMTVKADARKGVFDVFDGATLVVTHTTVAKGERVIIKEHIEELIRPRWERARQGVGGARSPHNTASPIRQMVAWPEVEVTDRPLSQYQELIEEVSR
jgi:transposase